MAVTQEQTQVEEKVGRGRPEQIVYPGLAAGKLSEVPSDYDYNVHKALKKDSFETPDLWYEWKAGILDAKAEVYRAKLADMEADAKEARHFAETYRTTGEFPVSKRAMAKKAIAGLEALAALREQMAALGADLEGVDLDAIAAKVAAAGK